jgi:hypothetical protein
MVTHILHFTQKQPIAPILLAEEKHISLYVGRATTSWVADERDRIKSVEQSAATTLDTIEIFAQDLFFNQVFAVPWTVKVSPSVPGLQ